MAKKVVVVGTLDTKGAEFKYIKDVIEAAGAETLVIDTGVLGEPYFTPDVTRSEVTNAAGVDIKDLVEKRDRGEAVDVMMKGATAVVESLYGQGQVGGIIGMGGSAGTTIGSSAMRALPVGVPKILVSTVASGDTRPYMGVKDLCMMYSVVDISGINQLSRQILANAALAIAGMVKGQSEILDKMPVPEEKPLIGATMFGVTTPCVTTAREYLESKGYEILVFHATGTGGQAMEGLIEGGFLSGVLDITTTEWCDELVGGVFSAGPKRLEAGALSGLPQVVSTGALDMVNFGPMETVPAKFSSRNLYKHNPTVTLMRTSVSENEELGRIIAGKLNLAKGPTVLFIPLKGVSLIDTEGQPFYGPAEDAALFTALKTNVSNPNVKVIEMDTDINDPEFALAMARTLDEMIKQK
ncbi:MAG: Tm-1-like ATP-binding domain-containing protein [Firmicutes bacterium]|nr:Tm-1-like ATP-binding domain-containing protein [Bacillota bacterium]